MDTCGKISCLFLLVILPLSLVCAETEPLQFRHYRANEGLSAPSVYSVTKDNQGFIWLATGIGLYRFDGYHFTAFRSNPNDTATLSSNLLTSRLFVDEDGDLWVGTADNGLNRINTSTGLVTRFLHDPANPFSLSHLHVNTVMQDHSGTIWVATAGGGLCRLNDDGNGFDVYRPGAAVPSDNANYIQEIIEFNEHALLLGTRKGIWMYEKLSESFAIFPPGSDGSWPLSGEVVVSMIKDGKLLWIATEKGLARYHLDENILTWYKSDMKNPFSLSSNVITHMVESPDGESIWVSTAWGLSRFDKETGKSTRFMNSSREQKSLGHNLVWGLYADKANLLWVGTDNAGLNMLDLNPNHFLHKKIEGAFPNEGQFSATAFCEDQNGDFWIGTFEGGLWHCDKEMNLRKRFYAQPGDLNSLAGNTVYSLFADRENNIWVGTSDGGVHKISGNSITRYQKPSQEPLSSIFEIIADKAGRIWIGSLNGLYYLKPEAGNEIMSLSAEPLYNTFIRTICEDRNGDLWVGTQNKGLFRLTTGDGDVLHIQSYQNISGDKNSINSNIVMDVHEDHSGNIWVATIQGLNKYQPPTDNFISYDHEIGLEDDYLYEIRGEDSGVLWISSSKGLIRFNPGATAGPVSRIYDFQSDVPLEVLYPYSFYLTGTGKIFVGGRFGSDNGYYTFFTDSLKVNNTIPPVVITGILIANEPIQTDSLLSAKKRLTLKHHQNFLSFEFAALDYTDPKKNRFACFLEGYENGWNYLGNRAFAYYTGIPPGYYVFYVIGSNNDGYWNETGASMAITILPPPWKTWWAYVIYSLLFVGFLVSWRIYDLKKQRLSHALKLEHVEAEKLKELDGIKSRFFTNISHEFRTPLTLILGQIERIKEHIRDPEHTDDLNMMQRSAKQLHNLVNEVLSLSRLESGQMKLHVREENIVSIASTCLRSFESLAQRKEIELCFNTREEYIPVIADKDKVERVFENLLSNAFKFSGKGGRIVVAIDTGVHGGEEKPGTVRIAVSDNGRGIAPEKLPFIFDRYYQVDDQYSTEQEGSGIGLALVRELVELHHGTIVVESTLHEGTSFIITLPYGKDDHSPCDEPDGTGSMKMEAPASKQGRIDPGGRSNRPLVMIIEDNDDLRNYIRKCLCKDYFTLEARQGIEGFALATASIPDLIISDVMMPKMDGYQLCRQIKADTRTSHIPVILLTARASMEDKLEGLETGADDFLAKPFHSEELIIRVKNLIGQREKLKEKYKNRYIFSGEKKHEELLSSDDKFMLKASNYIKENLSNHELGVVSLSSHMALSQSQLNRKMKALTGLSPNEMIRTLRLHRAAELLLKRSGNIAGIAYEVGFNNPSYFSECFRKQFGKHPSEYSG